MEGDFNAMNKIVYGVRMLQNARKHNQMPEEIFSKKNRMADGGTLCKTLFFDIARQARVGAAITSVDASNCYDRIAHAMALLIFQAFGVPITAVQSMLGTIGSSYAQDLETQHHFLVAGSTSKLRGCVKAMVHPWQDGQLSAYALLGCTGRRDMGQNFFAQSPSCNTTSQ
jgi:hypothetical protein